MKKKSLNAQKINLNFKNKFATSIYKNFEKKIDKSKAYAVAVSGGPDSLALAFLTKCFSLKNNTKFNYYLVDHKLRPESSKEAEKVIKLLKKIKINCKILEWKGKKPKSNIQSLARFNRYSLLIKECKIRKIENIILGHHRDDRDENFFIRLTRGTGLKGLVSLSEKSNNFNINFLRPLLNIKKSQLIEISTNIFSEFIKDPSNENLKFKRIRVRNLIKELEKEGLDKKKLDLTINNLKDSNNALEFYSNKNVSENSFLNSRKKVFILKKGFFIQPNEIVLRSIIKIIQKVSNKYYPPRGKSVIRLLDVMRNQQNVKNLTLGGCVFKKVNETIIISREIN
tara:strand:+ start:1528 stop:2547 length:1020 start_codon:yes stop_codon:yes gene_type:complete